MCVCVLNTLDRDLLLTWVAIRHLDSVVVVVGVFIVHSHCLAASCGRLLQFNKLHSHARTHQEQHQYQRKAKHDAHVPYRTYNNTDC